MYSQSVPPLTTPSKRPVKLSIIPITPPPTPSDVKTMSIKSIPPFVYKHVEYIPSFVDWIKFTIGLLILIPYTPFIALQISISTLWDYIDRHTINLTYHLPRLSNKYSDNRVFNALVRNKKDGFLVPITFFIVLVLPGVLGYELWRCYKEGFSVGRCMVFSAVRIGPMYCNFMWVYVLCHKEAHLLQVNSSIFAKGWPTMVGKRLFNHFGGFIHGLVPGAFNVTHIYNHHVHDNSILDVHSTLLRPRNSLLNFTMYVTEWFLYATNLSSLLFFARAKEWRKVTWLLCSTLWYLSMSALVYAVSPKFYSWYILYPLVEGNVLLCVVNYTWHAFVERTDVCNAHVTSTNVVDGLNFCMKEEYHTVHHLYPLAHWSRHKELFEGGVEGYKGRGGVKGSVFFGENLFVIFGACVAGDYVRLRELFYAFPDAVADADAGTGTGSGTGITNKSDTPSSTSDTDTTSTANTEIENKKLEHMFKERLECYGKEVGEYMRAYGRLYDRDSDSDDELDVDVDVDNIDGDGGECESGDDVNGGLSEFNECNAAALHHDDDDDDDIDVIANRVSNDEMSIEVDANGIINDRAYIKSKRD